MPTQKTTKRKLNIKREPTSKKKLMYGGSISLQRFTQMLGNTPNNHFIIIYYRKPVGRSIVHWRGEITAATRAELINFFPFTGREEIVLLEDMTANQFIYWNPDYNNISVPQLLQWVQQFRTVVFNQDIT